VIFVDKGFRVFVRLGLLKPAFKRFVYVILWMKACLHVIDIVDIKVVCCFLSADRVCLGYSRQFHCSSLSYVEEEL